MTQVDSSTKHTCLFPHSDSPPVKGARLLPWASLNLCPDILSLGILSPEDPGSVQGP